MCERGGRRQDDNGSEKREKFSFIFERGGKTSNDGI
jgi:hypothetical protein